MLALVLDLVTSSMEEKFRTGNAKLVFTESCEVFSFLYWLLTHCSRAGANLAFTERILLFDFVLAAC